MIHGLETMLDLPKQAIIQISEASGNYSMLKNGLTKTGLYLVLKDASKRVGGMFFAPPNAAS